MCNMRCCGDDVFENDFLRPSEEGQRHFPSWSALKKNTPTFHYLNWSKGVKIDKNVLH